jgi:hypothetical protein
MLDYAANAVAYLAGTSRAYVIRDQGVPPITSTPMTSKEK